MLCDFLALVFVRDEISDRVGGASGDLIKLVFGLDNVAVDTPYCAPVPFLVVALGLMSDVSHPTNQSCFGSRYVQRHCHRQISLFDS